MGSAEIIILPENPGRKSNSRVSLATPLEGSSKKVLEAT